MIDLGLVDAVDAEAIGVPGQRTFRVRARSSETYASLWIEKEQLAALGRGISQLLAERGERRQQPVRPTEMGSFADTPHVDLQVVRLAIDYQPPGRLILLADDQSALDRGDTPTFRMEITHEDALGLTRRIVEVVAAGRPRCPLCGQPMEANGQHFCPGSDGHSTILPIPDRDEVDDSE